LGLATGSRRCGDGNPTRDGLDRHGDLVRRQSLGSSEHERKKRRRVDHRQVAQLDGAGRQPNSGEHEERFHALLDSDGSQPVSKLRAGPAQLEHPMILFPASVQDAMAKADVHRPPRPGVDGEYPGGTDGDGSHGPAAHPDVMEERVAA
jgi:hypothetical protein